MQYSEILAELSAQHRLRTIPRETDRQMIDLLSNDYMGLAASADDYSAEFMDRFGDAPFTSAASRLLSRRHRYHNMLEEQLSHLYHRPALIFNSGYHANVGLMQALAVPGTLILSDRLIHASSIDGIRLAKREFRRFAHNDINDISRLLSQYAGQYERVIIVIESVYSMDGDLAPLQEIIALKHTYPNLMVCLDEAHAFGVRGANGLGLAEELGLIDRVDIIVGTLGKAAASVGAFIIADEEIISLLINTARPFIFSTALPPVNCAWSSLMIEKLTAMSEQREYLRSLSSGFITAVNKISPIPSPSQSQIIPVITGDAELALRLAERCNSAGYDCMAIRRPTVPPGGERLRISLNATLTPDVLSPLLDIIRI
ncbi:MAG: 8-amino-7-oxononanoate synthase [Muribaculaceae bacterium]|nr:8-amino-7-oxononanoate synthase [Muribaculaceae bacterium]